MRDSITRRDFVKGTLGVAAMTVTLQPAFAVDPEARMTNHALHRAAYQSSSADSIHTAHLATDGNPGSFWRSAPSDTEWMYVDLAESHPVSKVVVHWLEQPKRSFVVKISHDGRVWREIGRVDQSEQSTDEVWAKTANARYVRLEGLASDDKGYSIRSFEVYGPGKRKVVARREPVFNPIDGRLSLTGCWRLQDAAQVGDGGSAQVSAPEFTDTQWLAATVPGTVLSTYLDNGCIPDPNYGDLQYMVSDSFSTNRYWYRAEFVMPESYAGKIVWLNFEGINYRAEIFVNGKNAGQIGGAFLRGRFDISALVSPGNKNCIAVLIHPLDHPGAAKTQGLKYYRHNGGDPGLDSPNFVSTIGWDWVPTIRGRNIGIWNDVYLSFTGSIRILDPFVISDVKLGEGPAADLTVTVDLQNATDEPQSGLLRGRIEPVAFEQSVELQPNETKTITLDKAAHPELSLQNVRLWWPNGLGNPELYDLDLQFISAGSVSDRSKTKFGIRKVECHIPPDKDMQLWVNGVRVLARGGNWPMDDSNLRYDPDFFDARLRYHREMNFNMIRNWVGMTAKDAFYDSCDKYGIMVWDEFWIANPKDGPDPLDHTMFLLNARDKIKRSRKHPCVVVWCGRNEGYPPEPLNANLKQASEELDGTRHYFGCSIRDGVHGEGPYITKLPAWYFENAHGFTTEMGAVAVPNVESVRRMMPEAKLWPINDTWATHDYQCSWELIDCSYYTRAVTAYGEPSGVEDFCRKAQMVNLETYKAIFEAWASKFEDGGSGVLLWTSQSVWPSLLWQTYDYYLEPTAAYFASRKACEPIHIFWNCATDEIAVLNLTPAKLPKLSAEIEIIDFYGKSRLHKSFPIDLAFGLTKITQLEFPLDIGDVQFLRLNLKDGAHDISTNFYWRSTRRDPLRYESLSKLPEVRLTAKARRHSGGVPKVTAVVANTTTTIVPAVRLNLMNGIGERVLPVIYGDNFFPLLPGESKAVQIEYPPGAARNKLALNIEGWNITPRSVWL
ncbi:MAG: discoidin domain-containing protein [Candidatus Sulfotelmatobacter sp.]